MTPMEITSHLARGSVLPVIQWVKHWLRGASYVDIRDFVGHFPAERRPYVASLLRDVLTDYPTVTWGLPVLISVKGGGLTLPLPERSPDPSVTRLRWLPLTFLDGPAAFGDANGDMLDVPEDSTSVVILLAKTALPAPPVLSDGMWWAELLAAPDELSICVEAGPPMPFPDAMEAGVDLLATVCNGATDVDRQRVFLGDEGWMWALDSGLKWRAKALERS